ncbi:fatty acyl-AMP ligase [Aphanizomenon flos-aquae]|jgi:acyl-CoA synthetase (AMP-forming)/AMP-acid ligase II|uniref:Fatty acyl-AMP ligase n=1 Tax=Aphanizomenon flos-aquae FACHB-1040 TaxID=2692887 RepID=A0ABR8C0V4_APHFL|nr:fatty acyl-AMP ligase [Aphanizomenon flos-aquae]MBD2279364.1 fatty acyl-AMP ligase [Aphanizomenon flos-aquae FACHB-1040]
MSSRHLNSLIDSLLLRAENQPHQPLYYFLDTRGREYAHLTYASLLTAVQQLATWLSEKTASGDRVTIQLPTSPEFVITFFACLYTNRIPVPLSSPNRKHNCEHYQRIFTDCDASLVVTDATVQDLFVKEGLEPSHQIETFPSLETLDPILTPVDRQSNKIAFLQYTSGSTSFPKGVMVSHENIIANQKMIQRTFGHSSNSIGLAWVPLFHDMGLIGSIFQPLYVGFPCYFMSSVTFLQRPKLWLKTISEKKVTTTGGPNFAYDLCVKRIDPASMEGLSLSSWDVAYNGAEHIKLHTLEQFSNTFAPYGFKKFAFLPCYGLAEATLIVSGTDKSEEPLALTIPCSGDEVLDADASPQKGHTRTVVSNGQIMPELSLRIINPQTLKECASHHIGEIWISGTSITPGYWQQPDKNQETFVYRDGLRFLRTGDLGFLDSQQRLYITGRLKDLIVIDGKNYYPQDIEETVKLSHPALNKVNCAVFSVSGTYAQRLVVVNEVVRQFAVQIYRYADEIKQAVQIAVYNHYQLTVHDTVLLPSNTIPRTTSGKIQRQRTKLLYLLQQLETLETVKESI